MRVDVCFLLSVEEEEAYRFIEQEESSFAEEIEKLVKDKLIEYRVVSLPVEVEVHAETAQ